MKNDSSSDQIRRFKNNLRLGGVLVELESKSGKNDRGDYIFYQGVVRTGPTSDYDVKFKGYVPATKKDGTEDKRYEKVKKWIKSAVPINKTSDPQNATLFTATGSFSPRDYVNKSEKLTKIIEYSLTSFFDVKEGTEIEDVYSHRLYVDGYLYSITDEVITIGEGETKNTGRKKMRFISRDGFGECIDFSEKNSIYIPIDLVPDLDEAGYEAGISTNIIVDILPSAPSTPAKPKLAIGKDDRVTKGFSHPEFVLVGGDPPYDEDSDEYLERSVIKKMVNERANKLKEIEEAGYQGSGENSSSSSSSSKKSVGLGDKAARKRDIDEDDEDGLPPDLPF